MDREAAKRVNSPETLKQFLSDHRSASKRGLVNDIDYVGVDKNFRVMSVKFKDSTALTVDQIQHTAESVLGFKLFPAQVEMVRNVLYGKQMHYGRKAGYTSAMKVAKKIYEGK